MKILPRADNKMQTAEFIELQSMLNYHTQNNFSYLYSFYNITQGLKLTLVDIGETHNTFILFSGQIYIETDKGAFFVDIDSQTLQIKNTGNVSIGVLVNILEEDFDEYKDPITGGEVFGSLGAKRLLIDYQIVIDKDSYPIAIVNNLDNKLPDITYYRNSKLTQSFNDRAISNRITKLISRRWFEEIGNFIAQGLEVSYDSESKLLLIHPGVAYINGKRIYLPYNKSIYLNPSLNERYFVRYLIVLNVVGQIIVLSEVDNKNYTLDRKEDTIALGSLDIYKKVITPLRYYIYKHTIIPSYNRILTVSDILNIEEEHRNNEYNALQAALDIDVISQARRRKLILSGILTDSLQTLDKSDKYNLLYSAALMPGIAAIRPSFTTKTKYVNNLQIIESSSVSISSKQGLPYLANTEYTSVSFIKQGVCTNWLNLTQTSKTTAAMNISPSQGNGVESIPTIADSSLSTLQGNILTSLQQSGVQTINTTLTTQARVVNVSCIGFDPNEDNLRVTFGNIQINQLDLNEGTKSGSLYGSVKATANGSVNISFTIPKNLDAQDYAISVFNQRASASAVYKVIRSVEDRGKSNLVSPPSIKSKHEYSGLIDSIAQTFYVDKPTIITSVKLKFRTLPNTVNSNYGVISLVRADYNKPTSDCLGIATLSLNNITTSNNGSLWSEATFDKPIVISSRGTYAIVFAPLVTGGEIFYAQSGEANLLDGSSTTEQLLLNGDLLLKLNDSWQVQSGADLAFELNKSIPSSLVSELVYKISDTEIFNTVELNLNNIFVTPTDTSIAVYYKDNIESNWKLLNKNIFHLQTASNQAYIKFRLNGNAETFPFVELDNLSINILKNNKEGSWISLTTQTNKEYTSCEMIFDCYQPDGTNITPRISSNGGYSWHNLELQSSQLIDGNIPLYRVKYSISNLSKLVSLNESTSALRTRLTLRIDFTTKDSSIIPFVRKLSSLVY